MSPVTDITTTAKFPYRVSALDGTFTITGTTYPASIDTAEAGKLQLRLTENEFPKGDYEITLSGIVTSTNLLNIPTGRFSLDGGATWNGFTSEVESTTLGKTFTFQTQLIEFSGAYTDLIVQMIKSIGTDTVTATFCSIAMKRVG